MIDAHQHFWHPARGDYGWMPADDPILSRPYGPEDILPELKAAGIASTVLVQAAPSIAETEYLLGIADASPFVEKVVGWIDFEVPSQLDELRRLAEHPRFVGVRPMVQDIEDETWILRKDIQWAFEALIELDLTFDCLGFPQHLPHFHTILTRYPKLRAVVDHGMKPQLRDPSASSFEKWAEGISAIARDTNAFCKLSGMVTEADTDWSDAVLKPFVDHLVGVFGAGRIMWGSDWPVSRLRCSYAEWHSQARKLTEHLGPRAQEDIFGGAAREFYRIS